MNNEIKSGVVFVSIIIAFLMTIFMVAIYVEYLKIDNKNEYLEMQIKEQSMLIEYLKKENK